MKRAFAEMNPGGKVEKSEKKMKTAFQGDPRLPPRIRQYLEDNRSKGAIVTITALSDDLQARYSDYSRKKRLAFRKSVEKAYEFVLRSENEDQKKGPASEPGDQVCSDDSASFSDDNTEYATYEDTNAMNSLMRNFYNKKPGSRPGSRPGSQPGSGCSTPIGGRSPYRPSDGDNSAPTPLFTIDRSGSNKNILDSQNRSKSAQSSPRPKQKMRDPENTPQKMDLIDLSNEDVVVGNMVSPGEPLDGSERPSTPAKSFVSVEEGEKIDKINTSKTGTKTDDTTKTSTKKRRKQEPEESKKKGPEITQSKVTFADVGGNDKILADVCQLLIHLKHPEVYRQLGVTPPRGVLLHGPPGCGKTLLAHAIAGELELPFLKIAATEIVSGVSGESEEKVRDVFHKAMANAPCVLFIDEIDSISQKRENASKDMERRIVSQLLTCMDELNSAESAHVLVVGATNRPDSLDPALRRAGRFDREISLGIPDKGARERILRVLCRPLRLGPDLDFNLLANLTPGFVGADLMALAREAAITAVNRVFKSFQTDVEPSTLKEDLTASESATEKEKEKTIIDCDPEDQIREKTPDLLDTNTPTPALPAPETIEKDSSVLGNNEVGTSNDKGEEMETESTLQENVKLDSVQLVTAEGHQKDLEPKEGESTMQDVSETKEENDKEFIRGLGRSVSRTVPGGNDLAMVLTWLKEQPPLTDEQLQDLWIEMADFEVAVKSVQPSAKREGFATIPDVTWSDIGALQDIREELQMAILAPVRHPDQFHALGLTSPPGILLAGPPGCGKTLLAKAVANESGINFISVKGPELLNMYVGESERAVRQVFQRARNSAPCVIFFDELDALCPKRSSSGEGGSSVRVVNQLLTEMDGLEERKQVFIMGASNRPDIIDPAILRPGRLDKTLYVGLPTASDRHDILKTITKNGTRPQLDEDVDLITIANVNQCEGFTGADLAALVREAAVIALRQYMADPDMRDKKIIVSFRHFQKAFSKIRPSVTENDKRKYESMKMRLEN